MRSRRSKSVSYNSKDGVPYRVVELFSGIGAQRMALMEEGRSVETITIDAREITRVVDEFVKTITDAKGSKSGIIRIVSTAE